MILFIIFYSIFSAMVGLGMATYVKNKHKEKGLFLFIVFIMTTLLWPAFLGAALQRLIDLHDDVKKTNKLV